jgi:hypothetical protein
MATKTSSQPITDFPERCDSVDAKGKWLGIARLSRIPDVGFPIREGCQAFVSPEEKLAGQKLIDEYRTQEAIAEANNADGRQRQMDVLGNSGGQHGLSDRVFARKSSNATCRPTWLRSKR